MNKLGYGLNLRLSGQKKKQQQPSKPPRPPPFGFNDEDEDDVERDISRQASKNKSLKDIEEQRKKALEEDPTVFDYDGVYDEMKEKAVQPQDRKERKPLRTKGWDRALVEYTAAMLTDTGFESKPPPTKRLHEITCPVLIVTGDSDRIVPSWNAQRLAQLIPGSYLEVIKHCGHLPHEEKGEEFVSVVEKFLQRVFGESEKQCLQAVT